jgi:hypothetical protein
MSLKQRQVKINLSFKKRQIEKILSLNQCLKHKGGRRERWTPRVEHVLCEKRPEM